MEQRTLFSTLCGDLNGKEIQKTGDICIGTADSFCYTMETDKTPKKLCSNKTF